MATFTIATSRTVMKNAAPTTARVSQRRESGCAAVMGLLRSAGLFSERRSNEPYFDRGVQEKPAACELGELPELAGQAEAVEDSLRLLGRARAPVCGEA